MSDRSPAPPAGSSPAESSPAESSPAESAGGVLTGGVLAGESSPAESSPAFESVRPFDVVIVAAGASRRMSGTDKLDAVVAGRPVLAWAVDSFARIPAAERIVVVAAADRVARYRSAPWLADRVAAVVAGGPRRQESVAAGVRWLRDSGAGGVGPEPADTAGDRVVLVHDGARPAVSPDLILRVANGAESSARRYPSCP